MTLHLASSLRRRAMDAIFNIFDGGALEIRSAAQEANPEATAAGVLLASCGLSATAFSAAAGGVGATVTKTANAIASASGLVNGTAAHFRLLDSSGTCGITGEVAVSASDLNMPVGITAGATITIDALVMSMDS